MPGDGSKQTNTWPLPKFRFEVDLGDELKGVSFQEVSGMDVEHQVVEYRNNNNPIFSVQKMPGLVKYANITLKRGIFLNDNTFWDWHESIKMNTIKRRTVLIKLLDEKGKVTMQWQLNNAWPTKITSTDLKSDSGEVAVDAIEIAHEQITIVNS